LAVGAVVHCAVARGGLEEVSAPEVKENRCVAAILRKKEETDAVLTDGSVITSGSVPIYPRGYGEWLACIQHTG
jgi:hypothetical protein